jgi:hypothetical protein
MDQTLPPRLPANLESAVHRVRMAARSAAEHTVDSLGLAALATTGVLQRDALLGSQYELNRKLAIFALTFNEALDTDVARQAGTLVRTPAPAGAPPVTPDSLVASWDSLTLVDDHELELHISADRFALEISHACEWEIRELDAYIGTLLGLDSAEHDRNPLRAEVVGQAMIRAVEAVSDRPEVRKVLVTEIGRSLAHAMRQTYGDIVADLRHAGVRPIGMALRGSVVRSQSLHGSLAGELRDRAGTHAGLQAAEAGSAQPGGHTLTAGGRLSSRGAPPSGRGGFPPSGNGSTLGASMGRVDGEMMALIRRLAQGPGLAAGDPGGHRDGYHAGYPGGHLDGGAAHHDVAAGDPSRRGSGHGGGGGFGFASGGHGSNGSGHGGEYGDNGPRWIAPNLIVAHREELRQHASGALDHMVIDVIASLFDQILADAKVPPQMARQIARLQLPVLRAALGDNSFFSSRRHPVRRFINRIASLGTAVDDFEGDEGRALLARVASLVQAVVDGEFEQIEVYEQQLQALEDFIGDQARAAVLAAGAADTVLARKETQLRVQHRFAQELETALQGLPVPEFLRSFMAGTWSRAIASAAVEEGIDSAMTQRLRTAGRELVMSVQPKATPAQRQVFLRQLPQLMKDLNTGLDRIRCTDAVRRDFFAQLMPAHAESLKGQALSTLEHNLLAKQVDGALAVPLPRAADLPAITANSSAQTLATLQAMAAPTAFTAAEARAVGLVDEAAVDWKRAVDHDPGAEPELTAVDLDIAGLPAPEAVEPSRGKSLAEHVQIGCAYLMQLQGEWQKVRLAHVSPGRSFFVFSHGAKQRETVSMTHRMLLRLCEAGRLRALESAYLLERATARARRQLAELAAERAPKKR